MGTEDLKQLVIFVCKLAMAFVKTLEDKKFNLLELVNFVPAVAALPGAVEGIENVPLELKDLDDAEKDELVDAVIEAFDIPNDEVEAFIEDAF